MTDRFCALHVALSENIRDDDAEAIINAIRQIRGVAAVSGVVADPSLWTAEVRVRNELAEKLWAVLWPK